MSAYHIEPEGATEVNPEASVWPEPILWYLRAEFCAMNQRVLHVLSQRPALTGSGVTLDALVHQAAAAGWEQRVLVGSPASAGQPVVDGLAPSEVRAVTFETTELPFPLPGMSDVMPYRSSRFSALGPGELSAYRRAWQQALRDVTADFVPDVIHSHHLWLVSSSLKDVFPKTPVVTHCHATGLRQMALCPHLADQVQAGLRRNERILVLHRGQAAEVGQLLGHDRIAVVGAGFRQDLFRPSPPGACRPRDLLYAGKLSRAKGLPWLLDAWQELAPRHQPAVLHIAGDGAGPEAQELRRRMAELGPLVRYHGRLDQRALAQVMAGCGLFVLPSFYEGMPLVLIEALACGCRLVATALPVVTEELAPQLTGLLHTVPLPRRTQLDQPLSQDEAPFVRNLTQAIEAAWQAPALGDLGDLVADVLGQFTWQAVFGRVESVWRALAQR